jgi:hypothetical protein
MHKTKKDIKEDKDVYWKSLRRTHGRKIEIIRIQFDNIVSIDELCNHYRMSPKSTIGRGSVTE